MRALRLSVAATALALAAAPFATAPAGAAYCNPSFQAVCDAVRIACTTLNEISGDAIACRLA